MQISIEETKKVAKLCNLTLSDEETKKMAEMLSSTLDYIKVLDELDVTTTSETFQVTGTKNVFQKAPSQTLTKEQALQNGSKIIKNLFATKAVFDR